jgi:hypothetical protein
MADERNRNRPSQQGPRDQADIDAQAELREDPSKTAPYQSGNLDAAADRVHATGEQTGTARRAEEASGQVGDAETAADAEQALFESRGNRKERGQWKRGRGES